MQTIVGKVRFDAQTKIINSGLFDIKFDYSKNLEYIEMLQNTNFIDVTEEQYQFIRSKNDNGIEMCVVAGKIQEYVIPESIKLENAKQEKFSEIDKFKKAILYAPLEYKNFILSATEKAQNNIVGALVSSFDKKQWIDIRGNDIELGRSEFEEIRDIIEKRSYLCYRAEADLINKISTAKDIAELNNIDIEAEFAKIDKIINIE
jgi:hypothetical protein